MKGLVLGRIASVATALGLTCLVTAATVHGADDPSKPAYYTTQVKPIFDANCAKCHLGLNHRGGFNMETREALLAGGHHGAAVLPGDPQRSLLLTLMKHEGPAADPMDMPPHADKLPDAQIAVVERWIKAGAVMPPSPPPAANQGVSVPK